MALGNILACFNPYYLPLQFVPFETLMLVRLDRFSSHVWVTLHHNHICFKSESEFITDDWMDPQYYFYHLYMSIIYLSDCSGWYEQLSGSIQIIPINSIVSPTLLL